MLFDFKFNIIYACAMEAFYFKFYKKRLLKQYAYTIKELAVTFCVLGITITVILMSMIHRVETYAMKQRFKVEFTTISQAYNNLIRDQNLDIDSYYTTGQNNALAVLVSEIGNYFEYKKACGIGSYYTSVCGYTPETSLEKAYTTLAGKTFNANNLVQGQYLLNDGANLYFRAYDSQYLLVFVDVNGYDQGPNVFGKDLLGITIMKRRVLPMGAGGTGVEGTCIKKVEPYCGHGFYCTTEDISGASCAMEGLYK